VNDNLIEVLVEDRKSVGLVLVLDVTPNRVETRGVILDPV